MNPPRAASKAACTATMDQLDQYIDRVKDLPPAPTIVPELLELLGQPDVDIGQIVNLIVFDPSLTASVLRLCNSAYLSTAEPVTDLESAVSRLGFRQVYQLVASVSGSRILAVGKKGEGIDHARLWKHSVTTAVAAQVIARHVGQDENEVFTAALLHDLGKMVFSDALGVNYRMLLNESEDRQICSLELEKELLGAHHGQVGGRLLDRWNFPDSLVQAVRYHHSPSHVDGCGQLAAHVYLGNLIANFMGHRTADGGFALRGSQEAMGLLKISPESLPHLMIETAEDLKSLQSLFEIGR
jgi:putative nucleotidyltransferase with HDIG domain